MMLLYIRKFLGFLCFILYVLNKFTKSSQSN